MILIILLILLIIIFTVYQGSKNATVKGDHGSFRIRVKTSFGYSDKVDDSVSPDKVWVPMDKTVTIQNIRIDGGMIYLGKGLASADSNYLIEPSLIDPSLPIQPAEKETSKYDIGYWPSYTTLSPEERFAYLKWLQEGRKNPHTSIGFVFIFFYGLERRLLCDTNVSRTALTEAASIIDEVQRLLQIYQRHDSFREYASRFVDFARVKFTPDKISVNVPEENNYGEFPLALSVGLSYYCAKGKPIPARWALYWYQNYPYYKSLRTPAERCEREFLALYDKKYHEMFSDGLIISEPKPRLKLSYKPATNSISNMQTLVLNTLPDVLALSNPLKQIGDVVEAAIDELDAFSRYLGRNPDEKNSLSALSLLPNAIDVTQYGDKVNELDRLIKNGIGEKFGAVFPAAKILDFWSFKYPGKITKKENMAIINLLDRLGYSIEPDVRFTHLKIDPTGKIIIFNKSEDAPVTPSRNYQLANLILALSMAVSSSDGEVSDEEKKHLAKHLEKNLRLTKAERTRLSVVFSYLTIAPPKLSMLRKHVDGIKKEQRRAIIDFLVAVAKADNRIDPEEIKILKKIYQVFGFDAESIYNDIHSIQATYAHEPVTVKSPEYESSHEHEIPLKKRPEESAFSLDETRLRNIVQDTNKVFGILKDIFEYEDGSSYPQKEEKSNSNTHLNCIANLDSEHSDIVRRLIQRSTFPRSEFEILCGKFKLLPDGVIETINESFFEAYNDVLIEADEDLIINQDVLKEILHG